MVGRAVLLDFPTAALFDEVVSRLDFMGRLHESLCFFQQSAISRKGAPSDNRQAQRSEITNQFPHFRFLPNNRLCVRTACFRKSRGRKIRVKDAVNG